MKKFIIFLLVAAVFIFPSIVIARIGVGVAVGKIEVDKPLKPGGVYDLTPLVVVNTGDEPSDYGIKIAYQSEQPELKPVEEWFTFEPSLFSLEPGQVQNIAIKLTLPVKVKPGDYFGYLEAHPVKKTTATGGTSISVAAATKLYFTVVPANVFQGMYYRIVSFWLRYSPWTWVVFGVIIAALVIVIFRKFFTFQLGVKEK
jgi:hypothetical protein